MEGAVGEQRERMADERVGITHKFTVYSETGGEFSGFIIANRKDDGRLGEVFLHDFGKQGSTLDGWVQTAAILFSIALQYGAEFPMLARKLAHTKFEPFGATDNVQIPYCRSVPDYIMRWLVLHFGTDELRAEMDRIHERLLSV